MIKLKLNLQFFAGDKDGKTEKPTAKKRRDARSEGQVAKSQEINTAVIFLVVFFALRIIAPGIFQRLLDLFYFNLTFLDESYLYFTTSAMSAYFINMFVQTILIVLPVFALSMTVGLITNLVQVGWHPTTKPLKPKFSKLNPVSGLKNIFSLKIFVDLVKDVFKFSIICYAIYSTVSNELDKIAMLLNMELWDSVIFLSNLAIDMAIKVGIYFVFVAAADYAYNLYKHNKDLKMSKQDIKDEHKNAEGDPQIKGKIRQKMREISMRRMMNDVPNADVIITNPTHFAVALKYDKNKSEAPYVIAKGADHLARRIKELAKENNVQIVEDKPLARSLYNTVEVGQEIPPELYQAVAEVLAFVYRIKNLS